MIFAKVTLPIQRDRSVKYRKELFGYCKDHDINVAHDLQKSKKEWEMDVNMPNVISVLLDLTAWCATRELPMAYWYQ